MADYQQFDTRESGSGAKLLSANRRTLFFANDPSINLPPGISDPSTKLPYPGEVGRPAGLYWPLVRNRRYRFKLSGLFSPNGGQQVLSLESAALDLLPVDQFGPEEIGYGKQATFGTTTALAANQLVTIDDFIVDCNDLLQMGRGGPLGQFSSFEILLRYMINNTGVDMWTASLPTTWEYTWADYNSYRFDKWE